MKQTLFDSFAPVKKHNPNHDFSHSDVKPDKTLSKKRLRSKTPPGNTIILDFR